jgi:hypothetical protein
MTGRPSKYTPELADKILQLVRRGVRPAQAARAAGLGERTFYTWMKLEGRDFMQFRQRIEEASALHEAKCVDVITQSMLGKGRSRLESAKWMLTHRYSERWGSQAVDAEALVRKLMTRMFAEMVKEFGGTHGENVERALAVAARGGGAGGSGMDADHFVEAISDRDAEPARAPRPRKKRP